MGGNGQHLRRDGSHARAVDGPPVSIKRTLHPDQHRHERRISTGLYFQPQPVHHGTPAAPFTNAENESNAYFRSLAQKAGTTWQKSDYQTDQILNHEAKRRLLAQPGQVVRKTVIGVFTFWYELTSFRDSLLTLVLAIGTWALALVGWRRARREGLPSWLLLLPILYLNIWNGPAARPRPVFGADPAGAIGAFGVRRRYAPGPPSSLSCLSLHWTSVGSGRSSSTLTARSTRQGPFRRAMARRLIVAHVLRPASGLRTMRTIAAYRGPRSSCGLHLPRATWRRHSSSFGRRSHRASTVMSSRSTYNAGSSRPRLTSSSASRSPVLAISSHRCGHGA